MAPRVTESEKQKILLYRKHTPTGKYKDIADEFNRSVWTVGNIVREARKARKKGR